MQTSSRIRRGRIAAIGAFALLFSFLTPAAQADDPVAIQPYSSSQCASGRFCLWSSASYSGSFWSIGTSGTHAVSFSPARAVWNRTGVAVRVYSGSSGTGSWICYSSGAQVSSTSIPSGSVRTMTSATC